MFQNLVFMNFSKRKRENQLLKEEIVAIFHEHHGRYGTIRIVKVLKERGLIVYRKCVGKLLHEMGYMRKAGHISGCNHIFTICDCKTF